MAFDHRPIYIHAAMNYGIWTDVNTAPTAFYGPINITALELTPIIQEYDRLISNMDGSIGEVLAVVGKAAETAKLSMTFNSMPTTLLSLVLGADQSAITQSATPIVDEAVTLVLNTWTPLANQYLNSSIALTMTDTASPAVVISASHFTVDYVSGLVMATNVAAVGDMLVSYTPRALTTSELYEAGKAKTSYLKLMGPVTEKITGRRGLLVIHQSLVSNSEAYDWVAGGFASGVLKGDMLTPTGYNSPYEFHYLEA